MWPPLPSLMSRRLDRCDRRVVVITEIAVTVAIALVVGPAVTAAIVAITAIAAAIAAQAKEFHWELLQTVRKKIIRKNQITKMMKVIL